METGACRDGVRAGEAFRGGKLPRLAAAERDLAPWSGRVRSDLRHESDTASLRARCRVRDAAGFCMLQRRRMLARCPTDQASSSLSRSKPEATCAFPPSTVSLPEARAGAGNS